MYSVKSSSSRRAIAEHRDLESAVRQDSADEISPIGRQKVSYECYFGH